MKEKSVIKKQLNKQAIYFKNKEVSKSLKSQLTERQKEKEFDHNSLAEKSMAKYQNQRSQEIRLKNMVQQKQEQTIIEA